MLRGRSLLVHDLCLRARLSRRSQGQCEANFCFSPDFKSSAWLQVRAVRPLAASAPSSVFEQFALRFRRVSCRRKKWLPGLALAFSRRFASGRKVKSKCLAWVGTCRLTPHSTGLAFSQPVNSNVMPQTQSTRVASMFENRSLVCEAKRDAGFMHEAVSVFVGCVRFEETSASLSQVVARLVRRGFSSIARRVNALAVLFLACLSASRSQGKAQFILPARFAFWLSASFKLWLVILGLFRVSLQSKPALFERAAKIVWSASSFNLAGITRRSTGLPSAAR
jgi:hypothetical protein